MTLDARRVRRLLGDRVLSRTPRAPRHRNTAATGARPLFTWVAVVVTAMLALQPLPAVAAEPTTPPTAAPGELVVQLVTPTGYVPAAGLGAPDFHADRIRARRWPRRARLHERRGIRLV